MNTNYILNTNSVLVSIVRHRFGEPATVRWQRWIQSKVSQNRENQIYNYLLEACGEFRKIILLQALLLKNKIYGKNQKAETNGMVPSKSFGFENYQCKGGKHHQCDHLLDHL